MLISVQVREDSYHDCMYGLMTADGYEIFAGANSIEREPEAHLYQGKSFDETNLMADMAEVVKEVVGEGVWGEIFAKVGTRFYDLETLCEKFKEVFPSYGIQFSYSMPCVYSRNHYCQSCDGNDGCEN